MERISGSSTNEIRYEKYEHLLHIQKQFVTDPPIAVSLASVFLQSSKKDKIRYTKDITQNSSQIEEIFVDVINCTAALYRYCISWHHRTFINANMKTHFSHCQAYLSNPEPGIALNITI